MMREELADILKERIRISVETQDNWDYGIEQCWQKEIELLSRNMDDTILFLENDCGDEEFLWLSEVFEEVAKRTQNRAFVDCLNRIVLKYPDICREYHIDLIVQYADGAIENNL